MYEKCTKHVRDMELALGDTTQRHLKTFIEEYLNAIQVFNHPLGFVFTQDNL